MSTLTPPEETGLRAVVAEDETLIRLDLVEVLTGAGYRVVAEAGDGIARLDGKTVFLPGTLPGERVRANLVGKRGDALLAEAEAVLAPSPDRVAPPCPHFATCGGCAIQHLADAPYAAWKRAKLVDALARAGYPDAPVGALAPTPPHTRRRADLAGVHEPGPGRRARPGVHRPPAVDHRHPGRASATADAEQADPEQAAQRVLRPHPVGGRRRRGRG